MVTYARSNGINRGGGSHWQLPEVVGIHARHARYAEPKLRYVGTKLMEWREAVEFLVRTAGEFPARALSPALFVGDKAISNYDVVGPNQYLFYAFDFRDLQEGTPIFIGWPQIPEAKVPTRFRLQIENPAAGPRV
jgi:hypothetical protein